MTTNAALERELADLRAGIPFHIHTTTSGVRWRCSSPYCDRGFDVRDEPKLGPGEGADDARRYRRDDA